MRIVRLSSKEDVGRRAAEIGAAAIARAIDAEGEATIILATGASQFEMLAHLVEAEIDWARVTAFHLDEYVGMAADHPASFRRYLGERVLARLPNLGRFVAIEGDAADLEGELARVNGLLAERSVAVCFAGIGENCHLAFNDPPADFATTDPYILVTLDDACRRQQFGEGWFASLDDVPTKAISMSVQQIMKSRTIVLAVSDSRKAEAVRHATEGPVSADYPASILQRHPSTTLLLDPAAAALLTSAAGPSSQ